MVRKCMFIAVLVSLMVLGTSLAGECETFLTSVRKWDFEDGKIGNWGRYGGPDAVSTTTEALSGKYSLNVKFDDKPFHEGTTSFDKGVVVTIKPALSWKEFNSISFRYLIEGEVADIRVLLHEIVEGGKGNWLLCKDSHPVIGKPAEFRISTDELRFEWSDNKADVTKPVGEPMTTGKVTYIYISVHNKKPVNSGLKFSLTLDDIVLGKVPTSLVSIMSSDVGRYSSIAIAARTREPILIDGKLGEWDGAVPIALVRSEQVICSMRKWNGPSDISAVAMLLWDNDYLYFGIKVQDDKVVCANPRTDYDLSANDAVNLYFRTSPLPAEAGKPMGKDDYAFCMTPFSPRGSRPVLVLSEACIYLGGYPHKEFPIEKVHIASSQYKNGYIIEMAVPWKVLKIIPEEGRQLGFFTHIHDSDEPSKRAQLIRWREEVSGNWWRTPSDWGRLLLVSPLNKKELLTAAVTTGVVPMTDHLEYEKNMDVICRLDFWWPLRMTAMDITGQIINIETKKIVADSLSFSTRTTPLSTQFSAKWNTGLTEDGVYAVLCKLGKEESISVSGAHFRLIGLSVEKRREEIALSKINLDNLRSQLKRKDFPCHSSWIVDKPLVGRMKRVHTERVNPAKWSLAEDPVTWEDLGGDFQGLVQVDSNTDMGSCLDTFFRHYDFGRCIKVWGGGILTPGWKELCEDIIQRELLVCIWAVEGMGSARGIDWNKFDYGWYHKMGRSFLWYEVGEQDGYYIGSIAPGYKSTSRKEAQKLFWDWTEKMHYIPSGNYWAATSSVAYVHQYGAMDGYRMLGLETAQALPSNIMMWAFLRGAGKQYGLLSHNLISIFNRWGFKNYTTTKDFHQYKCGPDKGTSLSLLKRLYYVTYMYGSVINGLEGAYFTNEKDTEGYPKLSPVGKMNVEAVKWCRKHNKDRGVQYTPVALLIDFTSGWLPPRHLYSSYGSTSYLVWGNMDYERGDYQIDNFFRWIYPQYEDCSYFKDERGFLTATPFGDKFDVLTSNVHQRILNQYHAICLLGEIEMTTELITKLKKFVADGGDLIISAAQAKVFGADFCGVSVSDKMHRGYGGLSLSDQKAFEEKEYIYTEVVPKTAKILAISEDKLPLITVAESDRGRVIVITPDYWMTLRLKVEDMQDIHPQRYELLKTVQHVLGQYFKDFDFIKIDGPEIQYIVNVTDNPKRLLVTLVNNSLTDDWQGSIVLKRRNVQITQANEWIEEKELSPVTPLRISVPKGELRVVEIVTDLPLFVASSATERAYKSQSE